LFRSPANRPDGYFRPRIRRDGRLLRWCPRKRACRSPTGRGRAGWRGWRGSAAWGGSVWTSERSSIPECARSEHGRVLADVGRPADDRILEAGDVAGEQRARRVLEAGFVAGDRVHETVRRFLALAAAVAIAGGAAGGLDQLAQRHRGPARLRVEPLPV